MYRGYGEETFEKVNRSGFEDPSDLPTPFILGNLENLYEGFLIDVSEPHLVTVCEDWDNGSKKNFSPAREPKSSN